MIVSSSHDSLYFGGKRVSDRLDVAGLAGSHYYSGGTVPHLLERFVSTAKDKAVRTRGGTFFRIGAANILPSSSIGYSGKGKLEDRVSWFDEIRDSLDLTSKVDTGSKVAGKLSGQPPFARFEPGMKELFKSAIWQGPVFCAYASSENAIAIDRRAAFLRALRTDLPTGTAYEWDNPRYPEYNDILALDGAVTATVNVPCGMYGLLPMKIGDNVILPTGSFSGTWTIALLRRAIKHGATLESIERAIVFTQYDKDYLRSLHDRIENIGDKDFRKLVYTRAWGRFASDSPLEGYSAPIPGMEELRVWLPDSKLCWYMPIKNERSIAYRPDIAAWIASGNAADMLSKQSDIIDAGGKIIAAHIDCYWAEGSAPFDDTWHVKDSGPIRFYGAGTYRHVKTRGDMMIYPNTDSLRRWNGNPWDDRDAVSFPWHFT